jgi:hypothetical protein
MWLHFVSRRLVVMELADISNLNPCEAAFRIRLFDRTSKFTDETSPERFNGFSLNLILQIFAEICRHILILVIIGQQYRSLYMKTYTPLPHVGNLHSMLSNISVFTAVNMKMAAFRDMAL